MPRSSVPPFTSHAPPLGVLLRQYAAGSALTCVPVDQGLLNRGYRLATTRGDYFLKHHFDPETADPAAIARQHRATQRLADLGVPVAPPLPGRDGRTVAVVGGHAYALHPWIDGRHRHGGQLSTVQCGRLGALLGVVHASLERVMPTRCQAPGEQGGEGGEGRGEDGRRDDENAGRGRTAGPPQPTEPGGAAQRREAARGGAGAAHHCSAARRSGSTARNRATTPAEAAATAPGTHRPQHPRDPAQDPRPTAPDSTADTADPLPATAPSADPADTFALIDDLLAHVHRHRPTDAFDELARHRLLERRALLEQHADRRPPPGGSVGWVHGDFHPFNLLYKGDVPAAIVDWDRLGVRPRAEEAVRAAAIFFVRPAGTLDLPKARAYARAYRRTAGATPSELAAAVHRVWWERLNDFWMLRWHYERGDTRADSQFPAASALAVWWTREYDAVCEAFAA
ncbi:phosphotransferase [Streptomyces sp. NPDC005474]|uniref:phosphotransferase n=1 Tax=Streptomyces sp. NPDC005474 TaxID=3154878 RepID=UPI003456E44F